MFLVLNFELDGQVLHTTFYALLDSFGSWLHAAPSTWLISTCVDAEKFAEAFVSEFPDHKPFFVVELDGAPTERLPDSAWEWVATQRRRELQRTASIALDPTCHACIVLKCEGCTHRNSLSENQKASL